ncbi:MAG: hypothetical protein QOH24_714, partial [Verrucomicrobiota bacterium]
MVVLVRKLTAIKRWRSVQRPAVLARKASGRRPSHRRTVLADGLNIKPPSVLLGYGAIALIKTVPFGVPSPVTLSHPVPVVSELSVPNVSTKYLDEN